jgi:hypothetical protein
MAKQQLRERPTVIQQFLDKACGAPRIVRPDVISNSDEIAICGSRNADFHIAAQAFPARARGTPSFATAVGRALRRAAKDAQKTARMYGTPLYVWENGKVVAKKP